MHDCEYKLDGGNPFVNLPVTYLLICIELYSTYKSISDMSLALAKLVIHSSATPKLTGLIIVVICAAITCVIY